MTDLAPVMFTGEVRGCKVSVTALVHLGVDKPYVVTYTVGDWHKEETRHSDAGVATRAALKWIKEKLRD